MISRKTSAAPTWKRIAIASAVAFVLLPHMANTPVFAAAMPACPASITGVIAGTCNATDIPDLTVSATGSVSSVGGGGYSYMRGILYGEDGASLTNSGSISATVTNHAYDWASPLAGAEGIYFYKFLVGPLTNNGVISALAVNNELTSNNAHPHALAYGIDSDYGLHPLGALTNNGIISATAINKGVVSGDAWARATSVSFGWDLAGTFTNNGKIIATATNDTVASASADDTAEATGIYAYAGLTGNLINNGSIHATANAQGHGPSAQAHGIYVYSGDLAGSLTNSGTIHASANAQGNDPNAQAYGIYFVKGDLIGSLTNYGTIAGTASDPAQGYALDIHGGNGTINNMSGGLLRGNLNVGGAVAVNNAGTMAIPVGAVASIAGNYTQQAGGVLETVVASSASYGRLTVGGTADLTASNTIAVRATPNNTLAVGNKLENILSTGSWVGLPPGGSINVIGSPLFTYSSVEDGAGNIDITITGKTTFAALLGRTGNSLGSTLDGLVHGANGGVLDPLLDALYSFNSRAEIGRATESLKPLSGGLAQATSGLMHSVNRIIQARQDANRGLSSGDEFHGDRNFWFKPFASRAEQGKRSGVAGFDARTWGAAFGVDARISSTSRIGGAFIYARSDLSGKTAIRQNGDVDSYQAIFYGSNSLDERTDLSFQADYGVHKNNARRNTFLGDTATSRYDSWSAHLGTGVSRIYDISPQTNFVPSLRADYIYVRTKGYAESGSVANLKVDGGKTEELILAVDGKVNYDLGNGTHLTANLGVGYDAIGDRNLITSSFVGGGAAFTTRGIDSSRWLLRGGLGVVVARSKKAEITIRYDIETRSSKYDNQTASIKVQIPF